MWCTKCPRLVCIDRHPGRVYAYNWASWTHPGWCKLIFNQVTQELLTDHRTLGLAWSYHHHWRCNRGLYDLFGTFLHSTSGDSNTHSAIGKLLKHRSRETNQTTTTAVKRIVLLTIETNGLTGQSSKRKKLVLRSFKSILSDKCPRAGIPFLCPVCQTRRMSLFCLVPSAEVAEKTCRKPTHIWQCKSIFFWTRHHLS